MRGFLTLPRTPDTDLDILCNSDDMNSFKKIAKKYFFNQNTEVNVKIDDTTCLYHPYFTNGTIDKTICNGKFRMDIYNNIFYLRGRKIMSPQFHSYAFNNKIKRDLYFIPNAYSEIVLLMQRNIYDLNFAWKEKHIKRIITLLENIEENEKLDELENVIKLGFPSYCAKTILTHIKQNNFSKLKEIFKNSSTFTQPKPQKLSKSHLARLEKRRSIRRAIKRRAIKKQAQKINN